MILQKISRRAALILGKAVGAAVFAVVGGTVAWLLDRERRAIQEEAIRQAEEPEMEFTLPEEAEDLPEEEEPAGEPLRETGDGDGNEA